MALGEFFDETSRRALARSEPVTGGIMRGNTPRFGEDRVVRLIEFAAGGPVDDTATPDINADLAVLSRAIAGSEAYLRQCFLRLGVPPADAERALPEVRQVLLLPWTAMVTWFLRYSWEDFGVTVDLDALFQANFP